ncbi:MAG TPA: hypothetical protein VN310_07260 [Candidatus Dormibacteraeota bacterium]|nr:hypothetical protein [Candidatus Dormibacteraeota bacterium]
MTAAQELRTLFRLRILQLATLGSLFAFVLWRSLALKLTVSDLDNWWHLKVGDWILQSHSFPHTGIFSATAANRPWAAYSWGYEILLSLSYKWQDILGMSIFGTVLTLLVAASVYRMTRRLSGRFWMACLIATATCSVFLFTVCPRPVYFSMMLFTAELTLILEANHSGRMQTLYWLPLIFFFWANLHIQFVYGLAVIGLLAGVNLAQRLTAKAGWEPEYLSAPTLPLGPLFAIAASCVLAACISPYSYHLYEIVYGYASARIPYKMIRELQPIAFQSPSQYLQLLLTGVTFFAVGRKKHIDPFKFALLILATVIGYRMMRDAWFICIVAAACLADFPVKEEDTQSAETWHEWSALAVVLVVAGLLFARDTSFHRAGLDAQISRLFPVNAVNYLRQHPEPGPLYNAFDWGGFLIWYAPDYPVAIDGRTDLYGDDLDARFLEIGSGEDSYLTDPYLNGAGIILLQREMPLTALLYRDRRFLKIYEDKLAVMFIRQESGAPEQQSGAAAFPLPGSFNHPSP